MGKYSPALIPNFRRTPHARGPGPDGTRLLGAPCNRSRRGDEMLSPSLIIITTLQQCGSSSRRLCASPPWIKASSCNALCYDCDSGLPATGGLSRSPHHPLRFQMAQLTIPRSHNGMVSALVPTLANNVFGFVSSMGLPRRGLSHSAI